MCKARHIQHASPQDREKQGDEYWNVSDRKNSGIKGFVLPKERLQHSKHIFFLLSLCTSHRYSCWSILGETIFRWIICPFIEMNCHILKIFWKLCFGEFFLTISGKVLAIFLFFLCYVYTHGLYYVSAVLCIHLQNTRIITEFL